MKTTLRTLLPFSKFLRQFLLSIIIGIIIILIALFIGMVGYHYFEHMPWMDAFVNAAMILSGMGPLTPLNTNLGKLFAGCYALFSGLGFIIILGVMFAPVIHRFLHKVHLKLYEES